MCKSTLIISFIISLLNKHSKNYQKLNLCNPIIPVPVSIFFNEILYLHYQVVRLTKKLYLKLVRKVSNNNRSY